MMASTRGTSRTGATWRTSPNVRMTPTTSRATSLGRVNERGSELPAPTSAASRTRPVDGHVTSLAVHAKHRRRGVARALMREVHKNMALEVDCAKLHVRCSNAQAFQLYAGLGYDVVGRRAEHYHDGEAAYLMQADVKQSSRRPTPPKIPLPRRRGPRRVIARPFVS